MDDFWFFAKMIFCLFVIPMGILIGLAMWLDSTSCDKKSAAMGFPHKWGPVLGCVVETPKGWVPIESYRVFGDKQ